MRRRGEDGFTLVEILVVSSLFLVVLAATLSAAASFNRVNITSQSVNDQITRARSGLDRGVRQMRNLARRIDAPVIARASSDDFIFQTSDPQRTWVRYCLQTRPDGKVWLWSLNTPNPVSAEMSGPCPGTGWTRYDAVAENVTNLTAGRNVPLFTFGCVSGAPAGCPVDSTDYGRIRMVSMELLIDDNPRTNPPEARVSSTVYLRNQNEPPTATFTARPAGTRQIILNASASFDAEGRNLRFLWFRAPAPPFTCDLPPIAAPLLWQGVTFNYTFPSSDGPSGTVRAMELVVCDPGSLQARFTANVTIP
jgi:prepilin-type N-terminal cleavage/methylation domain-containing protein